MTPIVISWILQSASLPVRNLQEVGPKMVLTLMIRQESGPLIGLLEESLETHTKEIAQVARKSDPQIVLLEGSQETRTNKMV